MSECREAFERNECEKYGNNYDDMKKNWDWYESQYGWRYPEDSPRGLEWKAWDKAWQHQQSKVDELQKRVDAVKQLIDEYRDSVIQDKTFQHALSIVAHELEQALNGGSDE